MHCSRHLLIRGLALKQAPFLAQQSAYLSTSTLLNGDAKVSYSRGHPVLEVELPNEQTSQFSLRPFKQTIAELVRQIQDEDGYVESVSFKTSDGINFAKSSTVDVLLRGDFVIKLNSDEINVSPPALSDSEAATLPEISQLKETIGNLYLSLNMPDYTPQLEEHIEQRLGNLRQELEPLEKLKLELDAKAQRRVKILGWAGLAYMAGQFGFLARLTWWEYSWDIMEPVTYFVTYGTMIVFYAYYVITQKDPNYETAAERQYLISFHKGAKKRQLDIERYNSLRKDFNDLESLLRRVRDPLKAPQNMLLSDK